MLELRPRRTAWLGFSAIPITAAHADFRAPRERAVTRQQRLQHRFVAMEQETDLRVAPARNRGPATMEAGPESPPIASIERINSRTNSLAAPDSASFSTNLKGGTGQSLEEAASPQPPRPRGHHNDRRRNTHDAAFQLAAIGAFDMRLSLERVVRAAHVALGRGGFSFWNRHGGNPFLNSSCGSAAEGQPNRPSGKKQAAEVNRNPVPTQERARAARRLLPFAPRLRLFARRFSWLFARS
jgi:hypothetical protein